MCLSAIVCRCRQDDKTNDAVQSHMFPLFFILFLFSSNYSYRHQSAAQWRSMMYWILSRSKTVIFASFSRWIASPHRLAFYLFSFEENIVFTRMSRWYRERVHCTLYTSTPTHRHTFNSSEPCNISIDPFFSFERMHQTVCPQTGIRF